MKNSFKKQFRISKQKDIVSILNHGFRWRCNIFAVIYRPNGKPYDRLAVLVSKKNGKAVERVRIKRIYRDVYQKTVVDSEQGCDILIRPYYGRDHLFNDVAPLYNSWRNGPIEKTIS